MKQTLFPRLLAALVISTQTASAISFYHDNLDLVVPDGNLVGLSQTHTVAPGHGIVTDVNVLLHVSGDFNGDLYATLTHSTGFSVLLNRVGRTADAADAWGYQDSGMNVRLDDEAANGDIHVYNATLGAPLAGGTLTGDWAPDARTTDPGSVVDSDPRTAILSAFNHLDSAGDWTLFLADMETMGTQKLIGWGLDVETVALNDSLGRTGPWLLGVSFLLMTLISRGASASCRNFRETPGLTLLREGDLSSEALTKANAAKEPTFPRLRFMGSGVGPE